MSIKFTFDIAPKMVLITPKKMDYTRFINSHVHSNDEDNIK